MGVSLHVYAGPALVVPSEPHPFEIIPADAMAYTDIGNGRVAMTPNHRGVAGRTFQRHSALPPAVRVDSALRIDECLAFALRYETEIAALHKHHGAAKIESGWFVFGWYW